MTTNTSDSNSSPLLSLPAELRNRIYCETFDNGAAVKVISTIFPEPALLRVNKQIRKEASTIFYSERTFETHQNNCCSDAVMSCEKKTRAVNAKYGIQMKTQSVGSGGPHWQNFLITLRRVHNGDGPVPTKKPDTSMPATTSLCLAMLELARDLQDVSWSRVEQILKGLRDILARLDPRWGDGDCKFLACDLVSIIYLTKANIGPEDAAAST